MSEQRFKSNCSETWKSILEYKENGELEEYSFEDDEQIEELVGVLNEQQEQLDLYKEAILTMLGLLADKGIIFSGVKDE